MRWQCCERPAGATAALLRGAARLPHPPGFPRTRERLCAPGRLLQLPSSAVRAAPLKQATALILD